MLMSLGCGTRPAIASIWASVVGGLDEDHVGPGLPVGEPALDRGVQPLDGERVGARDQHEIGVGGGVARGAELLGHLRHRDHRLVIVVAAPLREHLILEMERRHPRPFQLPHGAAGVQGIAVAGVGIGDDGHARVLHDARDARHHLGHADQAEIGIAHAPRDAATGGIDRGKARARGEAGREAVVDAGRDDDVAPGHERPERAGGTHARLRQPLALSAAERPAIRPKTPPAIRPEPPG
jgi:hypothetical protein